MTRIRRQQPDKTRVLNSIKHYLPKNDFVRLDSTQFQRSFRLINALVPWFRRQHTCSHEFVDLDVSMDSVSDLNPVNPKLLTIRKGMDLTSESWDTKWKKVESTLDTILTRANLPDFSKSRIRKNPGNDFPKLSVMAAFMASGYMHRNLNGDDFCEVEEMYKYPPKHSLRCLWIGHLINIVLKDIEHPSAGFRLGKWFIHRGYYTFAMPCFEATLTRFINLSQYWFSALFVFAGSFNLNTYSLHETFLNSRPPEYFRSEEFFNLEKYFDEHPSLSNQILWFYYRIFAVRSLLKCSQENYPYDIKLNDLDFVLNEHILSILPLALKCFSLFPKLASKDREILTELIYSEIILINAYCLNLKVKSIEQFANTKLLSFLMTYLFALETPNLDWNGICRTYSNHAAPLPDLSEKCKIIYHRVDIRPELEQVVDQILSEISWEMHWDIVQKLNLIPIQRISGWVIHFNLNILNKLMKRFDVKAIGANKKLPGATFTFEKLIEMYLLYKDLTLKQDNLRKINPLWAVSPQKRGNPNDFEDHLNLPLLYSQLKKRNVKMDTSMLPCSLDKLGIPLGCDFEIKEAPNVPRSPLPVRKCRVSKRPIYEDPDENEFSGLEMLLTPSSPTVPSNQLDLSSSENTVDAEIDELSVDNLPNAEPEIQLNLRSLPTRRCRLVVPGAYNEDVLIAKALSVTSGTGTSKSQKTVSNRQSDNRRDDSIYNLISRYQPAERSGSNHSSANKENDYHLPVRECRRHHLTIYNETLASKLASLNFNQVPITNEDHKLASLNHHIVHSEANGSESRSMINTPPTSHHSPANSPPHMPESQPSLGYNLRNKRKQLSPTASSAETKDYSPESPQSTTNEAPYSKRLRKRNLISYNEDEFYKIALSAPKSSTSDNRPQPSNENSRNLRQRSAISYNENLKFRNLTR